MELVRMSFQFDRRQVVRARLRLKVGVEERVHERRLAQPGLAFG